MGDVSGASNVVPAEVSQNVDARLLNMFMRPQGGIGVTSTFTHIVQPNKAISPSDNEFTFDMPLSTFYTDLQNINLYVKGYLAKRDDSKLEEASQVSIANNLLHTLFSSATVYLGHSQLELLTSEYPYKALVRQLMKYKTSASDMVGQGLSITLLDRTKDAELKAASSRVEFVKLSKKLELMGPLLVDFFQTSAYLLPSTPVRVKLRKSRDAFYVVTDEAGKDTEYNFFIDDIALHIPGVSVSPSLVPLLEMQTDESPAAYYYDSLGMKQFPLSKGTITRKYPAVFQGKLPSKVMVAFFTQSAFSGTRNFCPLMTADVNLRCISLSVNGMNLREINVDFDNNIYLDAYMRFLKWFEKQGEKYLISYETFKKGYKFMCFDMLENCQGSCSVETLAQGFIDIHVTLTKALEKDDCIMCVFYISPETLYLNKQRVARTDTAVV